LEGKFSCNQQGEGILSIISFHLSQTIGQGGAIINHKIKFIGECSQPLNVELEQGPFIDTSKVKQCKALGIWKLIPIWFVC